MSHMTRRTSGPIVRCFNWMIKEIQRGSLVFRRITLLRQASFGTIRCTTGTRWIGTNFAGGSIDWKPRCTLSIWYGWITSAGLNHIGPSPAGETTAMNGEWIPGPRGKLLQGALRREKATVGREPAADIDSSTAPIIAEDLGMITDAFTRGCGRSSICRV